MTRPIPEGYNTVTPSLIFKDPEKAIELYQEAFDAKVVDRYNYPDTDRLMHAVMQIGDSRFMFGGESPEMPSTKACFYLYLPDCDAAMKKAKVAGMSETMPAEDMFWGDRLGAVKDEFGNEWSLATHKQDLSREEIDKGAREFMRKWEAKEKEKAA